MAHANLKRYARLYEPTHTPVLVPPLKRRTRMAGGPVAQYSSRVPAVRLIPGVPHRYKYAVNTGHCVVYKHPH